MAATRSKPANLREACLDEALAIIEAEGVEALSLREVARRLGVSHQAPYKHFPSRDHILAEIVARAFESFARHLDARPRRADPQDDLAGMCRAYLDYARAHPLQYRLMFGDLLPDLKKHPDMMRQARHAFALLNDCLTRLSARAGAPASESAVALDALFVWSGVHGLARILQSRAAQTLELPPDVVEAAAAHLVARIGQALERDEG
ncbi:MAG: TetR/AcrR family transcriptional regulator [Kiloniellales bacterium]|nr:TetR/AcrR family transcriptional regulator [Kiloniellales bacterium]